MNLKYGNKPSEKQNTVNIAKDDVKRKLKSIPDWKEAGPDKIQGFWLKSWIGRKKRQEELDRWTRKQLIAGRALHLKSYVM